MRLSFCILFLFIFLSSHLQSQEALSEYSIKCTYQYDYQSDSTDAMSKRSEIMLLLINKRASYFVSWKTFMYDSVSFANTTKMENNHVSSSSSTFAQFVTPLNYKILKDQDSTYFWQLAGPATMFTYGEAKNELKWNISEDTMTISDINCQKATVNYSGREWIAWFAPAIPIQDGPYKFCNLPGLIVKVSDTQSFFSFTLKSFENKAIRVNSLPIPSGISIKRTNKNEFLKYQEVYKNNRFEMDQASGKVFTSGGEEIRKYLEEQAKKNNNAIEIYK